MILLMVVPDAGGTEYRRDAGKKTDLHRSMPVSEADAAVDHILSSRRYRLESLAEKLESVARMSLSRDSN